ncbi:MAG: HEAT repeat domain-containing protein [Desulfovibrionaceae bacterium]|nr:HEAT repeat domain-containing protein [Desulfovibrionaceae bacterium]MBF0514078.1 HEAT repeat domain-containing protein [Desulfovibrionaceae bacterium]
MSDTQAIIADLQSPQPHVQREAARSAGELRLAEALPHLARLIESANLGVQEAADYALRKIGGKEVVAAVSPLLRSDDAPVRNIAMDILREVGSQDFPALVDLLHDQDADIRIFTADILGSSRNVMAVAPLCEALLKDPEVNVRYQAAVSLGELARREAAKCLNKALGDEEWVQFAVIEALAKIRDESSVGALLGALNTATDLVASMIVDALGQIGNIKAVALLLRRMDSSPTPLRNKIVMAVVNILGGKSLNLLTLKERDSFGDYLLAALADEDEAIQDAAMEGLAHLGGDEASAKLLDLAGSLDPDSGQERLERAINALVSIGLNTSLESGLTGPSQARALVACKALGRIPDQGGAAALMRVFWRQDRDLQRENIAALLAVAGPEAKDFFIDILARHQDGTVIKGALHYLGQKMKIGEAADKMLSLLSHPYDDVKEAALEACIHLGGEQMAGKFRGMFLSADPMERLMAVYALGRLGALENFEELKAALEDEIPDIRKVALEAIGDLACGSSEALELVVSKLTDESREVRLTVVDLLGKCRGKGVLPHLLAALDDGDDWVKIRAMEALGRRKDPQVIPHFVPLLGGENKLLVLKAVETLGEIGGESAFRALLEITSTDDGELLEAAQNAIEIIQDGHGVER